MAKGKFQKWLEPDNLILLEAWARDGLTDSQLAHNMGINVATLYEWKKKYSDIDEALKRGKEVVDIQVENALLKRALGYEYDEISEEFEMGVLSKRKITKKQVVPDTTAQIFWLKNRRPEQWRDKPVSNAADGAAADSMKALAEILLHSKPNRSLKEYE